MMAHERHMRPMHRSTIQEESAPIVADHRSLKDAVPVSAHASPSRKNVYPEMAPSTMQMATAGIHPTPAAMPAESVRMPAPATLLIIWKAVSITPVVVCPESVEAARSCWSARATRSACLLTFCSAGLGTSPAVGSRRARSSSRCTLARAVILLWWLDGAQWMARS